MSEERNQAEGSDPQKPAEYSDEMNAVFDQYAEPSITDQAANIERQERYEQYLEGLTRGELQEVYQTTLDEMNETFAQYGQPSPNELSLQEYYAQDPMQRDEFIHDVLSDWGEADGLSILEDGEGAIIVDRAEYIEQMAAIHKEFMADRYGVDWEPDDDDLGIEPS